MGSGKQKWWGTVAAFAVVVVIGLVVWGWFLMVTTTEVPGQVTKWNEIGDAFAPLIGVFTAIALLAALWSVKLQREELRATREDMKLQREAQQDQARLADFANRLQLLRMEIQLLDVLRQSHDEN